MAQDRRDVFGGRASSGGVYSPDPEDEDSFGDGSSAGPRGPLILALGSAIIIILAVVVWNAYRDGVKPRDADGLPVIEGDANPVKVPGDGPGEAGQGPGVSANNVIPEAEIEPAASDNAQQDLATIVPDIAIAGPDNLVAGPVAGEEKPPSSVLRAENDAKPFDRAGRVAVDSAGSSPAGTAGVAPIAPPTRNPEKSPAVIAPGISAPASRTLSPAGGTASGVYLVQLGSVRSADAAEIVWADSVKAIPGRFTGIQKEVERVELGPQGIFFRVRAGPFANRAAAEEFCGALKTVGKSCFATPR